MLWRASQWCFSPGPRRRALLPPLGVLSRPLSRPSRSRILADGAGLQEEEGGAAGAPPDPVALAYDDLNDGKQSLAAAAT